jgi:Zn ribbon nucleic-acid-binding protein
MTEQLEQDLVIASEFGFAVAAGQANTVDASMACPVCHNADTDYLAIHEDNTTWIECLKCLNVYEVDEPESKVEAFDPETRDMAELVLVERY